MPNLFLRKVGENPHPRDESEMSVRQLQQEIKDLGPEPGNPVARAEWKEDMQRVRDELAKRTK